MMVMMKTKMKMIVVKIQWEVRKIELMLREILLIEVLQIQDILALEMELILMNWIKQEIGNLTIHDC